MHDAHAVALALTCVLHEDGGLDYLTYSHLDKIVTGTIQRGWSLYKEMPAPRPLVSVAVAASEGALLASRRLSTRAAHTLRAGRACTSQTQTTCSSSAHPAGQDRAAEALCRAQCSW